VAPGAAGDPGAGDHAGRCRARPRSRHRRRERHGPGIPRDVRGRPGAARPLPATGPAGDPEPGLPPEVPRTAYIAFSTGQSWADLARRYSEIVDQAIRGADGPARVVETLELFGAPERELRSYYAVADTQSVRQVLKSYAASSYLSEDLGAVEYSKATDLSTPLRLRVEVNNARRGFTDTAGAGVGLSPAALLARLPAEITSDGEEEDEDGEPAAAEKEAAPRSHDYVFARPMTLEVRYRVVPPPGFAPQPLPVARARRFATATLSEEYAAGADGAVTATFRLDTGKRRISAQELAEMRESVREALQEKISLLLF
jgi:hypothetical protein